MMRCVKNGEKTNNRLEVQTIIFHSLKNYVINGLQSAQTHG
jgi:hypothetical protein